MNAVAADRQRGLPVQTYAKLAGVLVLLSFVGGGFGEAYIPSKLIVATEAAVEACCDVTLALIFYVLLKPVHRYVSLLAAFFGLMGTATFAAAELFYFAPTLVLKSGGYLRSSSRPIN